jgi:hypothetical protein
MFVAALLGGAAFGNTVWLIDNNGRLYSSPDTSALTQVGGVETNKVTALAAFDGTLYGINDGGTDTLYSINETTGAENAGNSLGNLGAITALAADVFGNLWAADATNVYELSTGGAVIKTYTWALGGAASDLEFVNTTLYVITGTTLDTVTVAGTTATATAVTNTSGIQAATAGLAYSNYLTIPGGQVLGYTATQIYNVNPGAAAGGTTALTGLVGGGTIVDAASDAAPEPATFAFIGIGLIGLGGFAYRRRKV